jgi:acyl-CoA synthetase (AMP-forming)/AMP-acid ligase II
LSADGLCLPASGETALIEAETDRALSYADLARAIEQAGASLAARQKSLLFLLARNDVSSVVAYLAALARGHAVALLDADLNPALRRQLLERYRPDFVWLAGGAELLEASELAGTEHAAWGDGRCWHFGCGASLHPELAVLLSTSGTTGSPKLVRLSRAAVAANAAAITEALGVAADDRAVASLPIFYAYGLSVLNSHLLAGASLLLTRAGPMERSFWDTLRRHQCSSFAGVPYTYQMLQRLGLENFDVPSLRVMTQAGGRLEPRLVERFQRHMEARGGRFFVMYGQTEAVARMAVLPPERLSEKLGSVGRAIPGGELRIDPGAAPAGAAPGVGEVVYRGPNVMLGYAESAADLARGDEQRGELRTGDLGYLDPDGFLFITGRSKRMGKVFGLRVSLDEVEELVRERGPAAVVQQGERLLVFCAFGDASALDTLHRELAARLRLHRSGLELRRIEALPTLPSGKIDYQGLPV